MNILSKIKDFFSRNKKLKLANDKETLDTIIDMLIEIKMNHHDLEEIVMQCVASDQKFEEFGRMMAHAYTVIDKKNEEYDKLLKFLLTELEYQTGRIDTLEKFDTEASLSTYGTIVENKKGN